MYFLLIIFFDNYWSHVKSAFTNDRVSTRIASTKSRGFQGFQRSSLEKSRTLNNLTEQHFFKHSNANESNILFATYI